MKPKELINSLPSQKQICEAIGWSQSSMSQCLKDQREMPKHKKKILIEYLQSEFKKINELL